MVWKKASRWAIVAGLSVAGGVTADPPAAPAPPAAVSPYAASQPPAVAPSGGTGASGTKLAANQAPAAAPSGAATAGGDKPAASPPAAVPSGDTSTNAGKLLDRPLETPPPPADFVAPPEGAGFRYPMDPPLGFAGRSSVLPTVTQGDSDFVPVEDRWRLGFPAWDRYGQGHPLGIDYPYDLGNICNPYKQNVLKGDYPIIGQNTFLQITATSLQVTDGQQIPTSQRNFDSTARPGERDFFGSPNHLNYQHYLSVECDLFSGDAGFKPADWRVVLTPTFNINTFDVDEVGVVNPNVINGTDRNRTLFSLETYFVETKLADTSPYYDFVSLRAGSQPFNNDFRGFLFDDINKGIRLFGTNFSNRDQFNVVYFRQSEKDTNSQLNTFRDRGQDVVIFNYFRQDFIFPGYTVEASFVYDHDDPTIRYDSQGFLVRPDPVGIAKQHAIDAYYFGLGGNGHLDRFNLTNQFYYVFGHDTDNPLAGQAQDIAAYMLAAELSYDRDWARFRVSGFYSSGDHSNSNTNNNNHVATGFDTILDNVNFAGGQFSYWVHNGIKLFGVNLKQADSLVPDLRSSKVQGQANFDNPGLLLLNLGVDFDLTPKLKMINNCNFLWFDSTEPLRTFLFDQAINTRIGTDLSTGFEYRPLLNNNIIVLFGVSTLIPGSGFRSIYDFKGSDVDPLVGAFAQLTLTY
jgi:hypothetical protein